MECVFEWKSVEELLLVFGQGFLFVAVAGENFYCAVNNRRGIAKTGRWPERSVQSKATRASYTVASKVGSS